jgi:hypothetical protein
MQTVSESKLSRFLVDEVSMRAGLIAVTDCRILLNHCAMYMNCKHMEELTDY